MSAVLEQPHISAALQQNNERLADYLDLAVPLKLLDIRRSLGAGFSHPVPCHGVTLTQSPALEYYQQRAHVFAPWVASHGDALLFNAPDETEGDRTFRRYLLNRLAEAIAVQAFTPGGIRVFGRHFSAHQPYANVPSLKHLNV